MDQNYYPEPGENTSWYGGCGIHNYKNRHEFDYCPHCLAEDLRYDEQVKAVERQMRLEDQMHFLN
jgi:hypothetical protein